ncbi:SGNH/GDSL hydrolase family protein [Krasilnikovia sp. M28-CT-15]|uniref:SGNH/GDSL hydrolase family protein n=1 Tax=Krasilnikovia sp. M28-CT-15 TaxID=3373540 RepID=UPI003876135D
MARRSPLRRVVLVGSLAAGLLAALGALPATSAAAPAAGARLGGAAAKPLRIMPLGDSITYGIGSLTVDGYREQLRRRLVAAHLGVDFVGSQAAGSGPDRENEGHPGWTIQQIAARAGRWLAAERPDVVLLQIGTNDMARRVDVAGAPARLSALIDQIRAARPAAQIFVAKIPSATVPGYQARITAFNAAIPRLVAGKGPRVHLVDQSSIDGIDLRDSVHPHDFGYAKMAFNWYLALRKVYGATAPVWPRGTDPYRATTAHRCLLTKVPIPGGGKRNRIDCAWTYLRPVTSTVDGVTRTRQVWQVRRTVVEKYRAVDVPAHDAYLVTRVKRADGTYVIKRIKVHVAATYVTRTRRVTRWVAY